MNKVGSDELYASCERISAFVEGICTILCGELFSARTGGTLFEPLENPSTSLVVYVTFEMALGKRPRAATLFNEYNDSGERKKTHSYLLVCPFDSQPTLFCFKLAHFNIHVRFIISM